ncbi:MAG: T9SS type A sorting domain-containing protein [Marinilabiliaceae bacterium]|nr:T9SS type A sorting domain-containing protein [Marinilabiliaceae bacterium]
MGSVGGNYWRFLASDDNTTLFINSTQVATLNFGDYYEILLTDASYITADKPILAMQYMSGSSGTGDPACVIVSPYEQCISEYFFGTPVQDYSISNINISIKTAGINSLLLNGEVLDPTKFSPVQGTDFSVGTFPTDINAAYHIASTDGTNFGLTVYGLGNYVGYAYPGGSGYEIINTDQAKKLSALSINHTTFDLEWTRGSGENCAVFVYAGDQGSVPVVNGQTYNPNALFGTGDQVENSGWYCVYNGTGNSVSVTGLEAFNTYRIMVLEYEGISGNEIYTTEAVYRNPINIETILAPSDLTYTPNTVTAVVNYTDMELTPSTTGDPMSSYSISPNLPAGLSLDEKTGIISGIATVAFPETEFTVIGLNVSGSTTGNIAVSAVIDDTPPIANCQDVSLKLNDAGELTLGGSSTIDNGSYDEISGIASFSFNPTSFDCSAIGQTIPVEMIVTDNMGLSSSCSANVTIVDDMAPTVVVQNTTVSLDASGQATITADAINNGSTDNCSIETLSLDITSFDGTNIGDNTITLTAVDASGNSNFETATVTVVDDILPVVSVRSGVTLKLDANGQVTVLPGDIDNGSSDNCDITLAVSPNTFSCENLGAHTVTLTATDCAGNQSSENTTITIVDDMAPTVIVQNTTVSLNASGQASITADAINNGSTDNCSIETLSLDITSFDGTNIGDNTITLTAVDASGNSNFETATVTVVDDILPVVSVRSGVTLKLDANGQVTVLPGDIDNGSSDNCDITLAVSPNTFSCENLGAHTVTLTATDCAGNKSSENTTITIMEDFAPVVVCPDNIEINLVDDVYRTEGIVLDPVNIDENCTSVSIRNSFNSAETLENTEFQQGSYTITWTVSDESNNIGTCSFELEVNKATSTRESVEDKLNIYPNPSDGIYNITGENITSLKVYDYSGKILIQKIVNTDNETINMAEYAQGLYFIELIMNNQKVISKIIKN